MPEYAIIFRARTGSMGSVVDDSWGEPLPIGAFPNYPGAAQHAASLVLPVIVLSSHGYVRTRTGMSISAKVPSETQRTGDGR